jgi:hypothetical protein
MLVEYCREVIGELPNNVQEALWAGEAARYSPPAASSDKQRLDVLARRLRSRIDAKAQQWPIPDYP